jgi:hypothetical protein
MIKFENLITMRSAAAILLPVILSVSAESMLYALSQLQVV